MKGAWPAGVLQPHGEAPCLFPARTAGSRALDALGRGSPWRILAPFHRGFYCQNQRGDLVFFGSLALEPGPLSVLCDFPGPWDWRQEGLQDATEVRIRNRTLWIEGKFGFPFGNARTWCRTQGWERWDGEAMASRMPGLCREASRRNLPDGFGPLIPWFPSQAAGTPNLLIRAAWPGIEALFRRLKGWLGGAEDSLDGADAEAVSGLIGLGPGLTPSGDDLLGGVMIALHALGRREMAERLGRTLLPRARVCTGTVSRAHLACAAGGEGSAALHDTISALCIGKDDRWPGCLARIDAIGATSGWDALAGVFLVMKAWLATGAVSH